MYRPVPSTASTTRGGSPTDNVDPVVTLDQVPRWSDAESRYSLDYEADDPSFSNSYFPDPLTSSSQGESSSNGLVSRFPVDQDINSKIYLWRGNPWNLEVDAVVNSTNENLDEAHSSPGVHAAAGPGLAEECATLSRHLFALVSDFILASVVAPIAKELNIRSYMLFTSSAKCFSFVVHYPALFSEPASDFSELKSVEIPGVGTPIPVSSIAPMFFIRDSMFASMTRAIASNVPNFDGILINTCHELELETLDAMKGGGVAGRLPPVFDITLTPCEFEKGVRGAPLAWLDDQPARSVVYISFGSRLAMSREQTREVGKGLIRSGYKFLWVVKDKPVDRDEEESLEEVLGSELLDSAKDKGYIAKEWVDQGAILAHNAIGGFVSHCGWNSVVEAAFRGVRVMAWPLGGDQRINAEVVERSGVGVWERRWGWAGDMVVDGEEIGRRVHEMMESEALRLRASEIGLECRGGNQLHEFLQELNSSIP